MQEIILKAKELALKEIEEYGTPYIVHFDLSIKKGQELSEIFGVDKDLVMLGTILMDIKLGQASKEKRHEDHLKMGFEVTSKFLKQFEIESELKNKILNCVEAHHGTVPFVCKEAEICANADCYRFIHPKGVFAYMELLGSRSKDFGNNLIKLENKLDEKWNILSLDICKKELEPYYNQFKKMISEAKSK